MERINKLKQLDLLREEERIELLKVVEAQNKYIIVKEDVLKKVSDILRNELTSDSRETNTLVKPTEEKHESVSFDFNIKDDKTPLVDSSSLDSLGLRKRIVERLIQEGLDSIDKIAGKTKEEIYNIKNFRKETVETIEMALKKIGRNFIESKAAKV